jgi:hypothetical protein
MDYSRLSALIIDIDKALLIFCAFLGIAIFLSAIFQEKLLIRRILQLIKIKSDLRALAREGEAAMRRVCPVILENTSHDDFLELTRSKSSFMPQEFSEELKKCFAISGKVANLEKMARSPFVTKWTKIKAIVALGYAEDARAFPVLKNTIDDKDSDVSYYAMLSLAQLKTNAAARALLDHCSKKPQDGRRVASCLEKFPADIIEELIQATYAESDSVRFWAIRVMTKFKNIKCLERITALTKDPNPEVRASSCECLGELADPKAEGALLERLNDTQWFVRLHAVRAVYKVSGAKAISYLMPLQKDPHWVIRSTINKYVIQDKGLIPS